MNVPGNRSLGIPKLAAGLGPGPWARRAACRGHDPNLWFRDEHDTTSYHEARSICAGCPVTRECLAWALDTRTDHGVFGGLSPRERRQLQPRRRRRAS